MNKQDKNGRRGVGRREFGRREFMGTLTGVVGASLLAAAPGAGQASAPEPITVQQVMDLILKTIPGAPFPKTVDTLKSGRPDQNVTGIVTTMFATTEVIQKTAAVGANFIIAHEPTFYNHADETDWLQNDAVYRFKHDLLTKNKIAVWRFHDYWHSHRPDGIQEGVLTALGWEKYTDAQDRHVITLPSAQSVRQLVDHAKVKLGIRMMRVIGDAAQPGKRILLLPGAPGGRNQITDIQREKPDVVICGEVSEWETAEYVRDARRSGQKLTLIVLGHEMSEEPGMKWLVSWLQPKLPSVKITHIPSGNPFTFL